jgi:hypothetical protein
MKKLNIFKKYKLITNYVTKQEKESLFYFLESKNQKEYISFYFKLEEKYSLNNPFMKGFEFINIYIEKGEKDSRNYFEELKKVFCDEDFLDYGLYLNMSKLYLISIRFLLEAINSQKEEIKQKGI